MAALDQTLSALDQERNALREARDRLSLALESMSQGLGLFDRNGCLMVANERLSAILLGTAEQTEVAHLSAVLSLTGVDGSVAVDFKLAAVDTIRGSTAMSFDHQLADGRIVAGTVRSIAGTGVLVTVEDVSKVRAAHAEIEYLANNDPLTGLANRARFGQSLDSALKHASDSRKVVVYCLDLDRFKGVNDTLGHAAGDALLQCVAQRIREAVRRQDVIARLGGDEFAILVPYVSNEYDISGVADRLVHTMRAPFEIDRHHVEIGISIGIAVAPQDAKSAADLLKMADIALYQAKADGRDTYRCFEPGMDELVRKRHELEMDLRQALVRNEFELHYQPLYHIAHEKIVGCEALLRWRHGVRGMVSPAEFIPVAEQTGLIKDIGAWVMRRACQDAVTWPDHMFVAVNLSSVQFEKADVINDIDVALTATGLDPSRLEVEITESVILYDTDQVLSILQAIKCRGVKISMDDFGTGYSSLSYLQKFPFDKIKIDRAFVEKINEKPDSLAIVRAISTMSRSLGILTTGEGVETKQELDSLREEGCIQAQGYLISKPLPARDVQRLLRADEGRRTAA